jgi:hypothetical protein
MATQQSTESNQGKSQVTKIAKRDREAPLHQVSGLLKVLSSFAAGDCKDDIERIRQASAIHGTLCLVGTLLEDIRAASEVYADSPSNWLEQLGTVISVVHTIRGQVWRQESSDSSDLDGPNGALAISNGIWALSDHLEHLLKLALYPHEIVARVVSEEDPTPQRH